MKIQDTYLLGTVAGVVATIPQQIWDTIAHLYILKSKYYGFQISAGVFLNSNLTNDPMGILLGIIVWLFQSSLLGVAITYIFKMAGKDFWWLKGLLVSNGIMYIWIYGLLLTLGAGKVVPFDIGTNWSILIGNIIWGLVCSYLIARWSSDEITPKN